jgi:site-specific recombinase XerC
LTALLAEPNRKTFVGLRDIALMALMADTGLRISETSNIRLVLSFRCEMRIEPRIGQLSGLVQARVSRSSSALMGFRTGN